MKNPIFKYGIVSMLVTGGFIAVSAFALPSFFASSEVAIDNGEHNSSVSRPRNTRPRSFENGATDVPEAEYHARLARIRQFTDAGSFEELVKEGDEIQAVWAANGGERFAKLILEVLDAFGYSRICDGHPEVRSLSDEYATVALARADSFSLESERRLLMRLRSFSDLPSLNDAELLKLRNGSKLWLHLFTRLERENDHSFDPYIALRKQLVPPEDPRWNGVLFQMQISPPEDPSWSGVVDPVAKARYQAEMAEYNEKRKKQGDQYKLLNVAEAAEPWGTKFLAYVYSKPPFSREELNTLLSEHPIAESLRRSILKARDDLVPGASQ
ncbi:MAG: hypothetical protein WBD27_13640 [Pyrinomonadaceae bacterium]